MFQTMKFDGLISLFLKNQRFIPPGCKDIGIENQSLLQRLNFFVFIT